MEKKKERTVVFLPSSFEQGCYVLHCVEEDWLFFFAEHKEAVPKFVCGVDIDGCGAGDETTGVPGSAEPRREMGVGLHFGNTSKCYIATLFISHVSILLCSLHRLFTPDSQSFLMETLGCFFFCIGFGFNSLNVYAIFHKVDRNYSLSV